MKGLLAMKLELERQNFLKAWQTAEKFTSTKTPKEATRAILITANDDNSVIIRATNLNTSVKLTAAGVNVLEPGQALIPAAIFGEMLRKSPSEDLVLEVNSARGLLNAGTQKTRFAITPVDEFPNSDDSSGADKICELLAAELVTIINEGSSASSQPQDFPKYLGTCLLRTSDNMLKCVSTDGKRLSLSQIPCEVSKDDDFLLLTPSLRDLSKTLSGCDDDDVVKLLTDGSIVWFALNNAEFSMRRVDSTFPKFERILNNVTSTTLRINAGDFIKALERVDIIAKTTPAHIMAMSLSPDGELKITARAPEAGTTSEVLQTNIDGNPLNVGFNVGYFIDGLKAVGNEQAVIEFSGDEGQTRLKREGNGNFLYMLMPARLTQQDLMTIEEIADFTDKNVEPFEQENTDNQF